MSRQDNDYWRLKSPLQLNINRGIKVEIIPIQALCKKVLLPQASTLPNELVMLFIYRMDHIKLNIHQVTTIAGLI